MSDIEIIAKALQDHAALKPNPAVAQESLKALERLVTRCGCVDENTLVPIKQAQQHITDRV